jgi:hypothetical protein
MPTGCPNEQAGSAPPDGNEPDGNGPLLRLVTSLRLFLEGQPPAYRYEVSGRRSRRPTAIESVGCHDPLGGEFVAVAESTPELVCTHTGAWPVLATPALPATATQHAIQRVVWVTGTGRLAVTAAQAGERLRLLGTILDPTPLENLTPGMLSDARLPASWANEPVDIEELAQAAKEMVG